MFSAVTPQGLGAGVQAAASNQESPQDEASVRSRTWSCGPADGLHGCICFGCLYLVGQKREITSLRWDLLGGKSVPESEEVSGIKRGRPENQGHCGREASLPEAASHDRVDLLGGEAAERVLREVRCCSVAGGPHEVTLSSRVSVPRHCARQVQGCV